MKIKIIAASLLAALVVAGGAFALTGCSGTDTSSSVQQKASIVGTWIVEKYDIDGKDSIKAVTYNSQQLYYVFEDGVFYTVSVDAKGNPSIGDVLTKYAKVGDNYKATSSYGYYDAKIEGNRLIIDGKEDGKTIHAELAKIDYELPPEMSSSAVEAKSKDKTKSETEEIIYAGDTKNGATFDGTYKATKYKINNQGIAEEFEGDDINKFVVFDGSTVYIAAMDKNGELKEEYALPYTRDGQSFVAVAPNQSIEGVILGDELKMIGSLDDIGFALEAVLVR